MDRLAACSHHEQDGPPRRDWTGARRAGQSAEVPLTLNAEGILAYASVRRLLYLADSPMLLPNAPQNPGQAVCLQNRPGRFDREP